MLNLKSLTAGLALASSLVALPAVAADDWHRSTGGVPPQAYGDDFFARGTGGIAPQLEDRDWHRATGGVAPQAVSDEFYSRGTGGVAPGAHAE